MKKNKYWMSMVVLFMVTGCGKNVKTEIPVIELSEAVSCTVVDMTEFADSLQVIPLETTKNSLIPEDFNIWRGEKYILISTNEMILQFSADGRFIRQLAHRGRAPQEYVDMAGLLMDETAGLVYVSDWRSRVKKYDLATGNFMGVSKWKYGVMTQAFLSPDNRVVYLPYNSSDDTARYDVCQTTTDGEWLMGLKAMPLSGRERTGEAFLQQIGDELYFKSDYSDTLYRVRDSVKFPELILSVPNPYTLQKEGGNVIEIEIGTADLIMLSTYEQKIEEVEGGRYVYKKGTGRYVVNKNDGNVRKFEAIYVSILGGKLPLVSLSQQGDYLNASITPALFRAGMRRLRNAEQIAPEKLKKIERLLENTTEDDNPFIITGKVRH